MEKNEISKEQVTNMTAADIVCETDSQPSAEELREQRLREMLRATLVNHDTIVEPIEYALSVDGSGIFSLGDIHGVKAKQKQGKTTALKVCVAALMKGRQFRLQSELSEPRVLWLDTEQNRPDVKLVSTDVLQMTDIAGDYLKSHLHVHALRSCNYDELYPLMVLAVKDFLPQVVIVDGIVEFVASFNDETLAKRLVHDLQVLSSDHHCAVVCVLHTNKADEDHNMRGHLGTMLAQKAGTVLECRKDRGSSVITVVCTESRHAEAPDWSIAFDRDARIVDADEQRRQFLEQRKAEQQLKRQEESERRQKERLDYTLICIRDRGGCISRKQLTEILCSKFSIERSTASKFITSQVEKGTLFEENKAISASPDCALAF